MINLAGHKEANFSFEKELTRCGIEIIRSTDLVKNSEVK